MYEAKILLDSISPAGRRLTTWVLTYPRFVHAELMTHRLFSRNSASSRAIPNEKLRKMVAEDPALPVWWGKNQSGMQAREELSDVGEVYPSRPGDLGTGGLTISPRAEAKREWLRARDLMLEASERLAKIGLHKQLCNRLIEPWMFITVVVSATSFDNWFHLRDHRDAQPEIAEIARMMHALYKESVPVTRTIHRPFIEDDDVRVAHGMAETDEVIKKVSVGRCARVSYLTHDGKRDLREDIALHDKLLAGRDSDDPMHMSPFEHVADALDDPNEQSGNFRGWKQYRKMIPGEHFGETLP